MGLLPKLSRSWILFVAGAGALALIVLAWGRCGEWQFSPDSFESRGVTCYYIPRTNVEIFRIAGTPYRPKIVQFWSDAGYLPASSLGPKHWDVVTGWHPVPRQIYGGTAKQFWYRAGCKTDQMADEWIEWSRRHPDFADRLWPEVVGLIARRGNSYALAGLLMNWVGKTPDPKAFEKAFADYRALVAEAENAMTGSGKP